MDFISKILQDQISALKNALGNPYVSQEFKAYLEYELKRAEEFRDRKKSSKEAL